MFWFIFDATGFYGLCLDNTNTTIQINNVIICYKIYKYYNQSNTEATKQHDTNEKHILSG